MSDEFDYKEFANQLRFQVRGLIPEKYSDSEIYVRDTVYKYSLLAGERVHSEDCKDNYLRSIVVQVIAEWVFHKTIDLIASGVPEELHEPVLNSMYSDLYDFEMKNLKQMEVLDVYGLQRERCLIKIEKLVGNSFKKSLKDLLDKNLIDKEIYTAAIKHSNMEEMYLQSLQDADKIQISVFDVLKGNIYFSIVFPLSLVVFYLMTVASFLSGNIVFGFFALALFCVLLWRFLTYETDVSLRNFDSTIPVSIWDVIKGHPYVAVLHFGALPAVLMLIIYFFDRVSLVGGIISVIMFLIVLRSFLIIKNDIPYSYIE